MMEKQIKRLTIVNRKGGIKMRDLKKIKKEIEAVDKHLEVKICENGLDIYPETNDHKVWTTWLNKIFIIALKYALGHYVDFKRECIRLYK